MTAKEKICLAYLQLATEKADYNKITISELTSLAGVSRTSYYRFFYDPIEIRQYIFDRLADGMRECMVDKKWLLIRDKYEEDADQDQIRNALSFFFREKDTINLIYKNHELRASFIQVLSETCINATSEYMDFETDSFENKESEKVYFVRYLAGLFISILDTWFERGFQEAPFEVLNIYFQSYRRIGSIYTHR